MMMVVEGIKSNNNNNNGGRVVGVGHDEDMADGMQCSDHPYRNNPGGICAFCLQEKLGKLVSSSFPLPIRGSSSSSSSPSFRSDVAAASASSSSAAAVSVRSGSSMSLSLNKGGNSNGNGNGNGNDCRFGHHDDNQGYYSHNNNMRRARLPFLMAKKKKKAMMSSIGTTSSSSDHRAAGGDNNVVFKRSKSTTTPRRGHSNDNNRRFLDEDSVSPRRQRGGGGFWSFLYLSSSSASSKSAATTTTASRKNDSKTASFSSVTSAGLASSGTGSGNKHLGSAISVVEEDNDSSPNSQTTASASSFERKVSRSRSVGCGSRSFSGDFFERISTGFGDCTLRRVESQREGKPKVSASGHRAAGAGAGDHHCMKERVRCGGIFGGFILTSSSSSSSSSSYWVSSSAEEMSGKPVGGLNGPGAGPLAHGRSRSWGWAFASPMRAFSKPSSGSNGKRDITRQASDKSSGTTPNLAAIPSLLAVRS
ncbi:vitellogenin-like protein [Trema orientale]|uniref:Vitellogenin-like protein n=1 Tax=Trema orientale TaxID=63057 RepID=A0A2P5ES34_TREOI|nr:vitellogenin-like protein [Trema orientale]